MLSTKRILVLLALTFGIQEITALGALAQSPYAGNTYANPNATSSYAANQYVAPQQLTMTLYQVATGQDGRQYVITRNGMQLPIPGAGVAPGAQQIAVYRDPQSNFWFQDRNGQPVEVTAAQLQWAIDQRYGQQMSAPLTQTPQPVQQTTIVEQPAQSSGGSSNSSGGGAGSVVATGLAAAAGGAVGGLISGAMNGTNNYYGMPYGAPLYRDGNRAYYNNNGKKVYVNQNNNNKHVINQWDHQGRWNDRDKWANRTKPLEPNRTERSFGRRGR